ncbi:helix-turn-helix domain-containing protein [Planktotalea sp.]|uniref:helix-turn-helix domain-containing protein n=1 Tax=Planktotalea sp. TaxID=2029877 RepID=UPI003D6BC456
MSSLEWIEVLRAENVAGKTVADIAREIGMPRPSVSMLINGTYPADLNKASAKHAAKVMRLYQNKVACPHFARAIGFAECQEHAAAPMSLSHPTKLKLWRACQRCEDNPIRKEAS